MRRNITALLGVVILILFTIGDVYSPETEDQSFSLPDVINGEVTTQSGTEVGTYPRKYNRYSEFVYYTENSEDENSQAVKPRRKRQVSDKLPGDYGVISRHRIRHYHSGQYHAVLRFINVIGGRDQTDGRRTERCKRQNYMLTGNREYTYYEYQPTRCFQRYCTSACPHTSGCRRRCPPHHPQWRPTTWPYVTPPPTTHFTECACDRDGSLFQTCDEKGYCRCRPNFVGKQCTACKDGFWKRGSICVLCDCNLRGAISHICDKNTGKCSCQPGIGGDNCNKCDEHYFGNLTVGCQPCEPCKKKGHICDPNSGKCSCPPFTTGSTCSRCVAYAWGYEPGIGCKDCECSKTGSLRQKCNEGGICSCKDGFEGEKCDKCSYGFFGYPNCKKCECNIAGKNHSRAECNPIDGRCQCKANVIGDKCDQCSDEAFGLDERNPYGCTKCFCFGRSFECKASNLTWYPIRTEGPLNVTYECKYEPPCWILPGEFTGDLTTSYGGYLKIDSSLENSNILAIYLTGHGVTLNSSLSRTKGEVTLSEHYWDVDFDPDKVFDNCREEHLQRDCFMAVLQNVTSIYVENKSGKTVFASVKFKEILLYNATNLYVGTKALTVEKCTCPKEYSSLSCQDPSQGYYRYIPPIDEQTTWIDGIIGIAKPCECNGHSKECDIETGKCLNCQDNTAGFHCENCAEAHYNSGGQCLPCECPSAEQNFASHCVPGKRKHDFICTCKKGYKGPKCDLCDDGYFGNPEKTGGSCKECKCHPAGRVDNMCDKISGECRCQTGFSGARCNYCAQPMTYIENGVCTACDECSRILFKQIDELSNGINSTLGLFKDGVGPPWKLLNETLSRYRDLSDIFNTDIDKYTNLLSENKINLYENIVDNIAQEAKKRDHRVKEAENDIKIIDSNSEKMSEYLDELQKDLDEIFGGLENFGTSQINVHGALAKAELIYKDMKNTAKQLQTFDKYKSSLKHCNSISEEVNQVYNNTKVNPSIVKSSLHKLKKKITGINSLLDKIEVLNNHTKQKNVGVRNKIEQLKQDIKTIDDKNEVALKELKNTIDDIEATREALQIIGNISKLLSTKKFHEKYNSLEKIVNTKDHSIAENEVIRDKVKEHVMELERILRRINSTLNFTKEQWDKIEAGESYEKIENGIREANRTVLEARKIFEQALLKIEPDLGDSVVDNASLALAFSDRLKRRIKNLHKPKAEFLKVSNDIERVKQSINLNGKSNNELTKTLRRMHEELSKLSDNDFMKIEKEAKDVINRMENIDKEITSLNYTGQHDLFKSYNNYLNLSFMRDRDNSKINLTRQELDRIDVSNIDYIRKKNLELNLTNPNIRRIETKLNELRNKIKYARQLANAVELPLQITNCSRLFRFEEQRILYDLNVTFVCNNNCKIFNFTSVNDDFMSLTYEVKDGSTAILKLKVPSIEEHTERITTKDLIYPITVNIHWYNGLLILKVNSSEETTVRTDRILFIPKEIDIGGANYTQSSIQKISINNKTLGLWNFHRTTGKCTGTYYLDGDVSDNSGLFFDGTGYRFVNVTEYDDRNRELIPEAYAFGATFGTFDNDSLLLLAQDTREPCSYFAAYLKNGKIELKIQNVNEIKSKVLKADVECNKGSTKNTIRIVIQRKKFNLMVTCNNQSKLLDTGSEKFHFRTRDATYYMGGVPPMFMNNNECVDVTLKSYLGYFKPVYGVYNDLSLAVSHGVSFTTKDFQLQYQEAVFKKEGYLQYTFPEPINEHLSRIDFVIMPSSSDKGQIMKVDDLTILLMKGNLLLRRGDEVLKSIPVKESQYNSISLDIDDQNTDMTGSIHFGDIGNADGSFIGELSLIEVNKRPIIFNEDTIKTFSNVDIGRHIPLPLSTQKDEFKMSLGNELDNNSIKDMQNTESCTSVSNIATDPGAVKFGDKSQSFIHILNAFWKKDYEIEFFFRTFYPNGVLFVTTGNSVQNIHYYLLEIRQGSVHLHIRKSKKKKVISFTETVNDGMWHHLKITHSGVKKKRKLTIILDSRSKKPMRVPKITVRGEIYIGGTPQMFTNNSELRNSLIQFRGCMKDIRINKTPQILVKNKNTAYSNIGQCFPNIEEGAYFGGDAYAVYKSDFQVNQVLELSFEFRTTERNGIILSVSNPGNSPALSVELQNGAVVMTIDMGNGVMPNVTKDLDSEYALCNNRWHNVTALYSSVELTVNVDGIRSSWVLSDINSLMHEIEAPLYIGGIPDDADTGTLKIRENFRGCIRKLIIEEKLMDWTDMEKLNNVLLNSCPVSP